MGYVPVPELYGTTERRRSHSSLERVWMTYCRGRRAEESFWHPYITEHMLDVQLLALGGGGVVGTTLRRWSGSSIIVARTFLAVTLLLGTSLQISHLTFRAGLLLLFEFLLGAAIAAGWLIRYAAALVLLGTIAASILALQFHATVLPFNKGTTVAVLAASGLIVCFGRNVHKVSSTFIHETNRSPDKQSCTFLHDVPDHNVEVTIRLERRLTRILRGHQCVVTIHNRTGGDRKPGQEAWYCTR